MKKKTYTIADIVALKGVSESQALRKMGAFKPETFVPGYMGRKVRAWNKEQIALAFPKAAKKRKA